MRRRPRRESVLLVGFGSRVATDVLAPLVAAGYDVQLGSVADLRQGLWDLVVSAPAIAGMGSMELLTALREGPQPAPGVLLVAPADLLPPTDAAGGVAELPWPFAPQLLVAKVSELLRAREPAPPPQGLDVVLPPAVSVPLLEENEFSQQVQHERAELRAGRAPGDSFVATLRLDELDRFRARLGTALEDILWAQVAELTATDALASERLGRGSAGDLLLLLPATSQAQARQRLTLLSAQLAGHEFLVGGQRLRFSPAIGYAGLRHTADGVDALRQAREAAGQSALHLDLEPVLWRPRGKSRREPGALRAWWLRVQARHAVWLQYLLTLVIGLVLPFLVYWGLGSAGFDISRSVYLFVVTALGLTAASIWVEGFLALKRVDPPEKPASPYPPATAIIAAYLPNEAPIIEDTIAAFLRVQYPARLQIILAYNTPRDMPEIEQRLREIAREHPQFIPMRVQTSTSKAQNVNAALAYATGEFTAVFDADHQPDPESFRRGWRWLSHGADVVQGHCFIRNGAASWVARMVAIEFEQIYAVSHPGRARLHGFGIFGGSNGYWRTDLLRELRMHGFMLTEDIDSSMRAVVRGRQIISDPYLVSRELAPETMGALTKQRLRWAQGWLQISLKWIVPALRSEHLSVQQKLGMIQLLAWRELYPWVSMQILPLIAWWAVEAGSLARIDWFVPLFVVTTLFTLSTGPGQIFFTWQLSDPQLRQHGSWYWSYVVTSTLFYAGLKNAWNRIAHYKEWRGETAWNVTPRVRPPAR
jgi:cellulose synthase/poly-beta-1,6-N-acetylglucosamine synthase-like glycosyltransferase/GGDEF domain-containing protein